jgi:hypothetical protein
MEALSGGPTVWTARTADPRLGAIHQTEDDARRLSATALDSTSTLIDTAD